LSIFKDTFNIFKSLYSSTVVSKFLLSHESFLTYYAVRIIDFGLAIFLNVRSAAFDPKEILKTCRAAESEVKNNSLFKASFRPKGDY
jgi:hypothetical protein